jgi:hypothetical protein
MKKGKDITRFPFFSLGEENLVAPLIATPNVDNANNSQEKGKKLILEMNICNVENY